VGFLNYTHPPAGPEVTTRGGTLILATRPYIYSELKHGLAFIPNEMARFVLLKAIRDSDWMCFREFYVASENIPQQLTTEAAKREHIRRKYYPQYSAANMIHWYKLHLSFLKETRAEEVLKRQNSLSEDSFNLLDPYCEGFRPTRFFDRNLLQPKLHELNEILDKALSIYKDKLLGASFVGRCETLKTIVQILMLDNGLFEDEINLSREIIRLFKDRNISLMRSNSPVLTEGRGLIADMGNEQMSFKLFGLN
jgi:hypothetical protein